MQRVRDGNEYCTTSWLLTDLLSHVCNSESKSDNIRDWKQNPCHGQYSGDSTHCQIKSSMNKIKNIFWAVGAASKNLVNVQKKTFNYYYLCMIPIKAHKIHLKITFFLLLLCPHHVPTFSLYRLFCLIRPNCSNRLAHSDQLSDQIC